MLGESLNGLNLTLVLVKYVEKKLRGEFIIWNMNKIVP